MGLCGIAAPFMFFASRTKPDETVAPEKKLDVFKVALGTAVMTTVFGVILLWTVLYSYDFETKPTKTIPALFIPQDNDGTEG